VRQSLALAVIIGLLLGIGVIAVAAKKYEGQTMYVYAGIFPYSREFIMEYIAPVLKEKWGIDLVVEEIGGKSMLQKIVVMKDRPTVTICGWDEPIGEQAAQMGLTAPIDITLAPNLKNLYDWAFYKLDSSIHVVTTTVVGIGLLYNEDVFAREGLTPPSGWKDLWREDLAGRISITAPESNWGTAALVAIAEWRGGGIENITPGIEALKELVPNIHTIHTWSSELAHLMELNEVWLGTTGSNMGPALKTEGLPVKWVAPQEGCPMVNGGISIIKNAPFQDVAHDFINLFFSLEYQVRRALWAGDVSPHRGVWTVLSPDILEKLPLTPQDFDKLRRYDWSEIARYRNDWIELFHREIG